LKKGIIYLVPNLLGETNIDTSLPQGVIDVVKKLKHFIVEDEKSARKFLKLCGVLPPYDSITFHVLNKHTNSAQKDEILKQVSGVESGILSEAGCPAIADPGADIIGPAHQKNFTIRPLVGPSSVLLGLMASGFNGQAFTFHGYLPVNSGERVAKLKELETIAAKTGYTQIFIETPFRNEALFSDILKTCKPLTFLSVSLDLTLETEEIKSANIADWNQATPPSLKGRPAVFSLWTMK
jgi:16S rRNA (cytidine1402-2'-O)-methyltransferase